MINLTDEQAQILATCAWCQAPLDATRVKVALEAGEVDPEGMACPDCGIDEEAQGLALRRMGAMLGAALLVERIDKAGLAEHFKKRMRNEQLADALRRDNRQN
jgi:hypothetical protein